jgi:uncharacterized phiE125 gp8 family phage protein
MWYTATVSAAAASEPVTSSEAKAHLRVDHSDEDTKIAALIAAASRHVEKYCGVRFITQTIVMKCDSFDDFSRLADGPVASITSITYLDSDGATQTLSTDVYELRLDGYEAAIILKYSQSWPTTRLGSQITVTAVVGAAAAPDDVKAAILLLIGTLYDNRAGVTVGEMPAVLPMGVDALLCNHRRGV